MSRADQKPHATFQNVYDTISRRLEALLHDRAGNDQLEYLGQIESMLDSLPLATCEFGLARNRIRNARRYYQAQEVGAARYELGLLLCSLRHRFVDLVAV